jgi:hypothetical protein
LSLEARRCLDAADAAGSRVQEGPRWSRASGRRELKSTAGVAQADGSIERAAPDTRVRGFGCYVVWYWAGCNPRTPLSLV